MESSGVSRSTLRRRVTPVQYAPPSDYRLDVELVSAAELRFRVARVEERGVERIDLYGLIYVTAGHYEHIVDFETFQCGPGSCLIIQPGQVHQFGHQDDWKGWMLIFRSELLQPQNSAALIGDLEFFHQVQALPTHVQTTGTLGEAVAAVFERMAVDATTAADARTLNAILRGEIHVLLMRLQQAYVGATVDERVEPLVLERFRNYRTTVEHEFRRWHSVAQYARHLGCSAKSLNRATREVADVSAKAFVVDRIVLEAKRLLAHTLLPISTISEQLGFDEPTNFVKFFRRETGTTPGAFQKRQTSR